MPRISVWQRENLRTNLWFIPSVLVVGAVLLFALTYGLDRAAFDHHLTYPGFLNSGPPDAARTITTAIAAALITVVSLVFSITIVALTLASTQFGPRMLRNFIRDRGTQVTLGCYVATFVYAILALASVSGSFAPHLSVATLLLLTLLDLCVLIYFIHHMVTVIQLPRVVATIAGDLAASIEAEGLVSGQDHGPEAGLGLREVQERLDSVGAPVLAPRSGYLQYVQYQTLTAIAEENDAVMRFIHRPGHFVTEGLPLATVWPATAAEPISAALAKVHATGPHRTLAQDLAFAIDQMVEIAIRALSAAVNDTFTALACVDWLSDALSKIASRWNPKLVHRDREGFIRVIAADVSFSRFVERSFDKVRQASRAMPAVMIRQLDGVARVMVHTKNADQRRVLLRQAEMVMRSCDESVPEPYDRDDVRRRYDMVVAAAEEMAAAQEGRRPATPRVRT